MIPKNVAALVEELNQHEAESMRLSKAIEAERSLDLGPYAVSAGVSRDSGNTNNEWQAFFRVFQMHSAMAFATPTAPELGALLRAREHYDRWLRGEESTALPVSAPSPEE